MSINPDNFEEKPVTQSRQESINPNYNSDNLANRPNNLQPSERKATFMHRPHLHCPACDDAGREHPQPFSMELNGVDGIFCGTCWFRGKELVEMEECNCESVTKKAV